MLAIWSFQRAGPRQNTSVAIASSPSSSPAASSATSARELSRSIREHSRWHPSVPPAYCVLSELFPFREVRWGEQWQRGDILSLGDVGREDDDDDDNDDDINELTSSPAVDLPNETLLFGGDCGENLTLVMGITVLVNKGLLVGFGFSVGRVQPTHVRGHEDVRCCAAAEYISTGPPLIVAGEGAMDNSTIRFLSIPARLPVENGGEGRHDGVSQHSFAWSPPNGQSKVLRLDFAIDGAAGERVVGVDVVTWDGQGQTARVAAAVKRTIGALRITTNFGRVFDPSDPTTVDPGSSCWSGPRQRQVEQVFPAAAGSLVEPGSSGGGGDGPSVSMLTGLYARRVSLCYTHHSRT